MLPSFNGREPSSWPFRIPDKGQQKDFAINTKTNLAAPIGKVIDCTSPSIWRRKIRWNRFSQLDKLRASWPPPLTVITPTVLRLRLKKRCNGVPAKMLVKVSAYAEDDMSDEVIAALIAG